ncbi:Ferrous iron transport periplasmic protein EfeO [Klebsiella pneumoniae]|uniref:Ferrous iron transport periplasmic protein EfeO n=1 Tax=Klebsiella pneumoniae TaxID=573 RepID=A0A2X3EXB2_KLEPN|nr:Ferrous iron transport periplasmic protein EfeO [Klebsiella pneumoniae]
MMIHFRRNALRVTVAALLSSAFGAQAADIPQVKVTVNDKQCEPMQVTVNAGKTQFIIQNHSQKALEWEILKGVMVVGRARKHRAGLYSEAHREPAAGRI